MADLEWTVPVDGGTSPADFALGSVQAGIARLTVNGVPLADVLAELALNQQEHADHGPGRINERCAFRAAVLRALAGREK